jgi:hypothetical protein
MTIDRRIKIASGTAKRIERRMVAAKKEEMTACPVLLILLENELWCRIRT